ncbi:unnamed protein product [Linum trigynum]|uniref:Uncharacterized protein n=1 Tax=Linum trigynum TaxID=586398 RepID=A0AAV2GQB1_9ROSI
MAGEIGDLRNPTRIFFCKSSIFSIDSTFRSRFEDATSNSLSDERVLLSGDSVAGRFQETLEIPSKRGGCELRLLLLPSRCGCSSSSEAPPEPPHYSPRIPMRIGLTRRRLLQMETQLCSLLFP